MLIFSSRVPTNFSLPQLTIVPTATMAEHLRHQQARAGLPVRPRSIRTFAQMLDEWAVSKPAPPALVTSLVEHALLTLQLPRFAQSLEFRGFQTAAAQMLEEVPAYGLGGDWGRVLRLVDEGLRDRGMARRNVRLGEAVRSVSETRDLPGMEFRGFYVFGNAEADLLCALGARAAVQVHVPEWPATDDLQLRLDANGFSVEREAERLSTAQYQVFSAPSMEREVEEIAHKILEAHAQGRPFRHMGVLLRSQDPYAPLLETTLARFGIPARFYFSKPLSSHPTIAYSNLLIRSLLSSWDLDSLLSAVRMPASGFGATLTGDVLDFQWRELLPSRGIPNADAERMSLIGSLEPLRRERYTCVEWVNALRPLFAVLRVHQPDDPGHWRSSIAAVGALEDACTGAALAFSEEQKLPLATFWRQVETILTLEPLRVSDQRRDVVQVMDAFEARQWSLPVVFICGMTERHFPQYHREDPLLGDRERRRLGLETAADRQEQERPLFDFAVACASEELYLSYPAFDEKGEGTLRSFFLDPEEQAEACNTRVRPRPRSIPTLPVLGPVQDRLMLELLSARAAKLSPSSIETFLQCPFRFFAQKTLRLQERPAEPRDRLNVMVQGSILHDALAARIDTPLIDFDQVFDAMCREKRIPFTYRTEAVRLELRRYFEAFIQSPALDLKGWSVRTELSFESVLRPGFLIRGRIDRLEQSAKGEALVIDYKYSAASRIKDRVEESGTGDKVQAGLYLAAAEKAFHLKPAGMLFCGLKKEITWAGWHTNIPGLQQIGTAVTPQFLQDIAKSALDAAEVAHQAIVSGRVSPAPSDPDTCRWCDYRDVCRVESIAVQSKAGGA